MTALRECLLAAADAVEVAQAELGVLDSHAGDGDHGTTMAIGARAVRSRLKDPTASDGREIVRQAALGMASVGGAIGPIYATGLMRAAAVEYETPVMVADLRAAAEAAEEAVSGIGGAKPGDKTVIDALHAVVESLRQSEAADAHLESALAAAADAVRAGAAETVDMVATVGRASRLGERSRGHADAGATSFAIAVDAAVDAYLDRPSTRSDGA